MKIIIINGYPESGKDTFVDFCREECIKHGHYSFHELHTSDPVKDAFRVLGWNGGTKLPSTRKAMADMMEMSNSLYDTSFKYIQRSLIQLGAIDTEFIVFVHCREAHNIARYKSVFDATTLLVKIDRPHDLSNDSDRNVEKHIYDSVVFNKDGLKELREKAIKFISEAITNGK